MRRPLAVTLLVLTLLILAPQYGQACGDKFLVVSRGVAYRHAYVAPYPASILIFKNPDSDVAAAVKHIELQSTLKMAGHRYEVVEDRMALEGALTSGRYDIVLVDLEEATQIQHLTRSASSRPVVLPVIYNPSRENLASARAEHKQVLKSPMKTGHLLGVIDRIMNDKLRASKKAGRR